LIYLKMESRIFIKRMVIQMRWKTFLFAGIAGAVAGYAITKKATEWLTPEKALDLLKNKARETYSISGAWIMVNREETTVYGLPYTVYKGGFSHSIEGNSPVHFEFMVDARTGTLIQLKEK
jgi:predicted small secreted protein